MICQNHLDVVTGIRRCSRCGRPFCPDCLVVIGDRPYCAVCKNEQILDLRSGVDNINLDLASIGKRWAAIFLDGLILGVPVALIVVVLVFVAGASKSTPTAGLAQVSLFLFPIVIKVVYEALLLAYKGQTIGKMALKIKVVNVDGSDISTGQAWGRAVVRTLLGSFYLFIVDYIPALVSKEKKTLHDMAARTRVINWI